MGAASRNICLTGAVLALLAAWCGPSSAQEARCSFTGLGIFPCELARDGGGLSFMLPDGNSFAFTLIKPDRGVGYLFRADAAPGRKPRRIDEFSEAAADPGCWMSDDKQVRFCVMEAQAQ